MQGKSLPDITVFIQPPFGSVWRFRPLLKWVARMVPLPNRW